MGKRGQHRDRSPCEQVAKGFCIHFPDVSHEAEINRFGRPAYASYDVQVGSGQAYGIKAHCLKTSHEILVDKTAVDHCDDLQHPGARDSSASYHLSLDPEAGGNRGSDLATAVDKDLQTGKGGERLEKRSQGLLLLDDSTADFHYVEFLFHQPAHLRLSSILFITT